VLVFAISGEIYMQMRTHSPKCSEIVPGHLYVTYPLASTMRIDPLWAALTDVLSERDTVRCWNGFQASADSVMMNRKEGITERVRFQAMCQALRPDLVRFAYWLCHDRELAEDVVQETMLRAWKAQNSLHDEKAAKPWLLTIVRRELARTFERKRLVTVNVDELVAREEPSLAAGDQDDLAEMRLAIFRLSEEYREPLVMQALLGYSTADIADELNLSVPAVLTRLFRARHLLRSLCGEDTSSDPKE
jgi:RNA polymerase sigma-70 factor, ECF subfamily